MNGRSRRITATFVFACAGVICAVTAWAASPSQGTTPQGNLGNCGGAFLSQIPFPFADYYSCIDLGSPPGVMTPYGGLTFKYNDSNTVLIGGAANDSTGRIDQIGVIRDANKHIIGFSGTARLYPGPTSQIGAYNDGGVAFGPGDVLFVTRYPANQLEQSKPGSTIPNKATYLSPLGVTSSVGSVGFVPQGFPGAGSMKLVSYPSGDWYNVDYTPDGNGTFNLNSATLRTNVGDAEGIAFVPAGLPGFSANSALIAKYNSNRIVIAPLDSNGDPLPASQQNFLLGLVGPEGVAIDPMTGDFLFDTSGADNRVILVRTLPAPPTPTPTPTSTPTAAPSATPLSTPTPTPRQCQFRVLIAYVDFGGHVPNAMREQIRLDLDVAAVDLFDASLGAPTLPKLQQYDIVMLSTNGTPYDPATLGNNLADYVDGGGVVVECAYSFPVARLQGRWLTGNYNPFDASQTGGGASEYGAYIHDPGHPLLAGVTTLNLSFLEGVTLPAGATRLASAIPGGTPLISYRPVSGGHTTVGIAAFLGFDGDQSGDWGKLIVNAARWLRPCPGTPAPTPTPTPPPNPCQFRVLIAYVDGGGHVPNAMREQIRLDLDVAAVDLFDTSIDTPTLANLRQYDVVMLSSNGTPINPATLGDNLAAYVDAGGVVVECAYSFPVTRLQGRWLTGNYNPFDASTTGGGVSEYGAYFHDRGHPLMAGVTALNLSFLEGVTLPAGATRLVSAIPGGSPLVAYRSVGGGHTTVGIAAFLGFDGDQSGDWGKLIVNAAR